MIYCKYYEHGRSPDPKEWQKAENDMEQEYRSGNRNSSKAVFCTFHEGPFEAAPGPQFITPHVGGLPSWSVLDSPITPNIDSGREQQILMYRIVSNHAASGGAVSQRRGSSQRGPKGTAGWKTHQGRVGRSLHLPGIETCYRRINGKQGEEGRKKGEEIPSCISTSLSSIETDGC